jgi:parallel beta-helix repeat protein
MNGTTAYQSLITTFAFASVLLLYGGELGVSTAAAQAPAPSQGWANVDCDHEPVGALQRALDRARSGDTIRVSGTCVENLTISEGKDRLTVDGGGRATSRGPDSTVATITVRGVSATLTGLTITGGQDGIEVGRGGTATIVGNIVTNTGRHGIRVHGSGFATIVDNSVEFNPNHGIIVTASSFALIGIASNDDVVASPNRVRNNGIQGVQVTSSSSARIVGNTISENTRNGINVERGSSATIADNTINANRQHGIYVTENSALNLGTDAGTTILDTPNRTTTNNILRGIACRVGGVANGRLGTLNGNGGPTDFGRTCVNSLDVSDAVEP